MHRPTLHKPKQLHHKSPQNQKNVKNFQSRTSSISSSAHKLTTDHASLQTAHQQHTSLFTPSRYITTKATPIFKRSTKYSKPSQSSTIPSIEISSSTPLYQLLQYNLSSHIQQQSTFVFHHPRQFSSKQQNIPSKSHTSPHQDHGLDQLDHDDKFDEILSKVLTESDQVLRASKQQYTEEMDGISQLLHNKAISLPITPNAIVSPIHNMTLDESVDNILNQPASIHSTLSSHTNKTVKITLQNDSSDSTSFESLLRKQKSSINPFDPFQISQESSKLKTIQQPRQTELTAASTTKLHVSKPFARGRSSAQSNELHAELDKFQTDPLPSDKKSTTKSTSFMSQFQGFVEQMDQAEIQESPNKDNYHSQQQQEQLQQKRNQQQQQTGLFGKKTTSMSEDVSSKPSPYRNRILSSILNNKVQPNTSNKSNNNEGYDEYQGSFGKSMAAVLFFGAAAAVTAHLCWWQINRRWWKLALIAAREDAIFQDPIAMQELAELVTELLVEYKMYDFGSEPSKPIDSETVPTLRHVLKQKLQAIQDLVQQITGGTYDGTIHHRSGITFTPNPPFELQPDQLPTDLAEMIYQGQHSPLYPTDLDGNPLDIPAAELLHQISFDNIMDAISSFKEKSQFHNVSVHGQFDYTKEMFVGPTVPPIDGAFKNVEIQKGYFVVTPLQLYEPIQVNIPVADNLGVHKINLKMVLHHVLVNRGWIPSHLFQTYYQSPITEHEMYSPEDLEVFDRLIRRRYDQTPEDSAPITSPPFPQYINYLPDFDQSTQESTPPLSKNWSLSSLLGENHPIENVDGTSTETTTPQKPTRNTPTVTQYNIDYASTRETPVSPVPDTPSISNNSNKLPPPTPAQIEANELWNQETTSRLIYQQHGLNKVKLDRLGLTMDDIFRTRGDGQVPFSIISNRTDGNLTTPLQPVNGVLHYGATYDLYAQADQTAKITIRGTEIDAFTFLTGPKFAVKMGVAPSTLHFPTGKTISLLTRDQLQSSASDVSLALHLPVPVLDSGDPVPSRRVIPVPLEAQHFDSVRLGLKRKSTDDHIKFKTMPETHAGYAITWGSFALIGSYLAAIQFRKPIVKNTFSDYFSHITSSFSSASKSKPKPPTRSQDH